MTFDEVMAALKAYGNEQTRKIYIRHGAREPFFGVKVGDLKKIVKKVKKNHQIALDLYATGNSDAMYLAGLIADENKMTPQLLQQWVEEAYWYMVSEYTVPWVAAESPHGWEMASRWIQSDQETIAAAGWSTYASLVSITDNDRVDTDLLASLIKQVGKALPESPNRVRYAMNGFVIATGCAVPELTDLALGIGQQIGKVHVDMGGTACKVPPIGPSIEKVRDMGRLGNKRKMARC